MRIDLFLAEYCVSCIGIEEEIKQIGQVYSIPVTVYTLKRHSRTNEMIAVDSSHNWRHCPGVPGVPAVLYMNKLFVGNQCGDYLRRELEISRVNR